MVSPLLSPVQLAASLGISVQTVYNRLSAGNTSSLPPCVYIGRLPRFPEEDVARWVAALLPARSPERVLVPKRGRGRPRKGTGPRGGSAS